MRALILGMITMVALGGSVGAARPQDSSADAWNPCEMESRDASSARTHMLRFLTDTGEIGEQYAATRAELGVVGVRYDQVVVVQDTIKCRAAINAWKRLYASFRAEIGAEAALFNNGMLFRLTPNRFILATPMINKYSGLTYLALDSNAVVVRSNL